MGISTDAYLIFGISMEEGDLEEHLIENPDEEELAFYEKYDESFWWTDSEDYSGPVTFSTHCHSEYQMYIVSPNVTGIHFQASRGYPCEVDSLPEISEEAIKKMQQWFYDRNIKWVEPAWQLCSYWG